MRRGWVALLFAPAACLFPDLGDLQGDASDVSLPDVNDDVKDAAFEASADADAGPEAGFCASNAGHAFCEDFDDGGAFNAQFTNVHLSKNGALAADTTEVVSAPRALLASIPALGTATGDQAYMTRLFTASGSKATFAFDFRVDSLPPGGFAGVFAAIVFDDGQSDYHTLEIYTTDTYAALEESFVTADGGVAYEDHKLAMGVPFAKWTRVSFTVDAATHTCSASFDGTSVLAPASIDSSWKPATMAIDLGLTYVGSETTAWQARYDDIVFDFQ